MDVVRIQLFMATMTITPLRNVVALVPLELPAAPSASGLVLMRGDHPTRRYRVDACGPETRDIAVNDVVLVNKLHGIEVGPWTLVAESVVLAVLP